MKTQTELYTLMAATSGMLDFPRAVHLAYAIMSTERTPGAVVEIGCYMGDTAAFIRALTEKEIWLYDSFAGLSKPWLEDRGRREDFQEGYLKADEAKVRARFANDPKIAIHRKWVSDLSPGELPSVISFAHIDVDLYEPTLAALKLVIPRMAARSVCIVDDGQSGDLPGVVRAVERFANEHPGEVHRIDLPGLGGEPAKSMAFYKL